MLNDYFQDVKLNVPWETYQQLPRHPAYRYEYRSAAGTIVGNPRYYHCQLQLDVLPILEETNESAAAVSRTTKLRELQPDDWLQLPEAFARAFRSQAPFRQLSKENRLGAARTLLERTRQGGDGPLVPAACLVWTETGPEDIQAAVIISLVPTGNLEDFSDSHWSAAAPSDAVEAGWGQPHLTWIFVAPQRRRQGLAGRLLTSACRQLQQKGYSRLVSTFLLGDHISTLWHWRVGFELAGHPSSPRRLRRSMGD